MYTYSHTCIYTYTHTDTLTSTHTFTHTHAHPNPNTLSHTLTHTYIYTHTYTLRHKHIHKHPNTHTHIHLLSCMHIHLHARTYLNPNTHIHTLTHIQPNPNMLTFTHTHMVSHRHTHLHAHTLTHTHTHTVVLVLLAPEADNGAERWFSPCHCPALPFRGQRVPDCSGGAPCVCTCRFPPPHSLLVSSWLLFMVCPPHAQPRTEGQGVSTEPVELDSDPHGACLSCPRSQCPGGSVPALTGVCWSPVHGPLSYHTTSLRMAASASLRLLPPSTVPAGGLP